MKNLFSFKQISIVLLLAFAFLFSANIAKSCSCMINNTVEKDFVQTPNIVILKLQSVEKLSEGETGYGYDGIKQSILTVERVFKGNLKVGQKLTFTQGNGGNCIWTFNEQAVGVEFLFYLDEKPGKDSNWVASTCSRSNSVKFAAPDLLYFEKLPKVRGKTRLSGMVTQEILASVKDERSYFNFLAERKIDITGNGKKIALETDENGVYEIYDLPPGKYKITPQKINGYRIPEESGSFEVEIKAKGHSEIDINYFIDNRIRGKFTDTNGKSLKDVCLELLPVRGEKPEYFFQFDCTDKDGNFEFERIPAGTYIIVVNYDGGISSAEPFGTFYYPSATKREDAIEITVGAGSYIDDLAITAPSTVETITVSGVIMFEDGKIANKENAEYASIEFFLEDKEKKSDEYVEPTSRGNIDEKGRFTIRILKGQKGKLFGTLRTYEGKYENCPKLEKLIRQSKSAMPEITTQVVEIDAVNDISEIELKFPFPSCKKAKID